MASGICTPEITKLDWNSINMDFFSGDDTNAQISQQVFTVGKTNKYNLDGAISKGNGKIIYSSVITGRSSFQVDDSSQADGWTPTGTGANAYIGVVLQSVQVFYALDIKYITGSTMTQFAV
jgi:hypothetical protein